MTYKGVNALAESVGNLNKAEQIHEPYQGQSRSIADVELTTLGRIHRLGNQRLHGYLNARCLQSSRTPTNT